AMGLELLPMSAGCCGHAGSFGYEAEHYDLSMQIAELNVLPAVRRVPCDILIIAEGFSCREQIRHGTGRWPMHPAEVMALAIENRGALLGEAPERYYLEPAAKPGLGAAALGVGLLAGAFLIWSSARVGRES